MQQRIASVLGLAQRAGKIVSGEFAVEKAVRGNKAKVLVLAADASAATVDKYVGMTEYYKVRLYRSELSKEALGNSIGKATRAAVAIVDAGFAAMLLRLL